MQFPGPAGNNAVEAALKLARRYTGRSTVVCFTNSFHGMTLGALSVTGSLGKPSGAGVALTNTVSVPFDGYLADPDSGLHWLRRLLDHPAAVIVETVQGEGGLTVARTEWLRELAAVCQEHELLLIVDDIQMGCGRTGPFFSFEEAGIVPDIVTLSKSISGFGLPLALTLFRRELDVWAPGEHNGTFRGPNPAFVTGAAALDQYWQDERLAESTRRAGEVVAGRLADIAGELNDLGARSCGRGLAQGLAIRRQGAAQSVCHEAFQRGLLVETSGPDNEVVKLLPPLTLTRDELHRGLDILEEAGRAVLKASRS